ncbi:hypothetical protein DsansV1_C14g0130971 [Dioscorea sansibarensis]
MQWIFQDEQFFEFYEITNPFRLKFATIHMEGQVIPWFLDASKGRRASSLVFSYSGYQNSFWSFSL